MARLAISSRTGEYVVISAHGWQIVKRFSFIAPVGLLAVFLTVSDWNFILHARAGHAVILWDSVAYGRSGRTFADARIAVNGQKIPATVGAWFSRLKAGQRVPVLYLESDPEQLVLNRFWELHFGSVAALAMCAVLVGTEVLRYRTSRRRQSSVFAMRNQTSGHSRAGCPHSTLIHLPFCGIAI